MKTPGIAVALALLVGAWAQMRQPLCDSEEAEEAAVAARDHLNGQHHHGYKYELNRIEDIKVFPGVNGDDTYVLEVDLLETDCHVLDPTPLANCTVRPKIMTAVEGDCDVVLQKVGGVMSVTAFKCKNEESTEDLCVGCFSLLPLNHTNALDFVHSTLVTLNNNSGSASFAVLEVGRMSSQIVSGGPQFLAEYVVIEANCTGGDCVPLNDSLADRGICTAKGLKNSHSLACKMYPKAQITNGTAVPGLQPVVHEHTGSLSRKHGLSHHRLTSFHNPTLSGHLSAESLESVEDDVPAQPAVVGVDVPAAAIDAVSDSSDSAEAPVFRFRRSIPPEPISVSMSTISETGPALHFLPCPGRVRYFD